MGCYDRSLALKAHPVRDGSPVLLGEMAAKAPRKLSSAGLGFAWLEALQGLRFRAGEKGAIGIGGP